MEKEQSEGTNAMKERERNTWVENGSDNQDLRDIQAQYPAVDNFPRKTIYSWTINF